MTRHAVRAGGSGMLQMHRRVIVVVLAASLVPRSADAQCTGCLSGTSGPCMHDAQGDNSCLGYQVASNCYAGYSECPPAAAPTAVACVWQDGDADGAEEVTSGISSTVSSEEECAAEVQMLGRPDVTGAVYHASSVRCAAEVSATTINPQAGYRSCLFAVHVEVAPSAPCVAGQFLSQGNCASCRAGTYSTASDQILLTGTPQPYALRFATGDSEYELTIQLPGAVAGVYTFSAWAKFSADYDGPGQLMHSRWTADSGIIGTTGGGWPTDAADTWEHISETFDTGSAAPVTVVWYVGYTGGGNTAGSSYITDLQLTGPDGLALISDGRFDNGNDMSTFGSAGSYGQYSVVTTASLENPQSAGSCGPPDAACQVHLDWAMAEGVVQNPDSYPWLTPSSPLEHFQCALSAETALSVRRPECTILPCEVDCSLWFPPGMNGCNSCQPGRYQDSVGRTECIDCPVGRYQNATGATACIANRTANCAGKVHCEWVPESSRFLCAYVGSDSVFTLRSFASPTCSAASGGGGAQPKFGVSFSPDYLCERPPSSPSSTLVHGPPDPRAVARVVKRKDLELLAGLPHVEVAKRIGLDEECFARVLLAMGSGMANHTIMVGGAAGWIMQDYPDITASVGDTFVFSYTAGLHDVQIMDNTNCDFSNSVVVDTSGNYSYTVSAADDNSQIIFGCSHPGHCAGGQVVTVIVGTAADAAAEVPMARLPDVFEYVGCGEQPSEHPSTCLPAGFATADPASAYWAAVLHNSPGCLEVCDTTGCAGALEKIRQAFAGCDGV